MPHRQKVLKDGCIMTIFGVMVVFLLIGLAINGCSVSPRPEEKPWACVEITPTPQFRSRPGAVRWRHAQPCPKVTMTVESFR